MTDKAFKQFENSNLPPPISKAEADRILRNHTIYLQACVNYIGRQLSWRKYVRVAFFTAVTIGAFRLEVVAMYFLLRSLLGW